MLTLRQYLVESGISNLYTDVENVLDSILDGIRIILQSVKMKEEITFMEKIYHVFIQNCDSEISDYSFKRLANKPARTFYSYYITVVLRRPLKQNIAYLVRYYKQEIDKGNTVHYFGKSYGKLPSPHNPSKNHKEYLDLADVNDDELVNLAIVKLKMEDDFVSFKLNKVIVMLRDYEIISTEEFNELIYGTTDQRKIEMTKMGMSISLIKRLENDGLLPLFQFDEYGNLTVKKEFYKRKSEMSDLYFFEVNRFL
jgi:hypothetical protein